MAETPINTAADAQRLPIDPDGCVAVPTAPGSASTSTRTSSSCCGSSHDGGGGLARHVHDRSRGAGPPPRPALLPALLEHGRLGVDLDPDRVRGERPRADGARSRRQPRRRVRGADRGTSAGDASCGRTQVTGRVIVIPCLSPAASKAGTRLWPSGANFNRSFPGSPTGPANEQLADYLTRVLFPMADAVIDIHTGGNSAYFIPCSHMHVVDDPAQRQAMLAGMLAWNTDHHFLYIDIAGSGLLPVEAEDQGKIVVTTELGGGTVDPGQHPPARPGRAGQRASPPGRAAGRGRRRAPRRGCRRPSSSMDATRATTSRLPRPGCSNRSSTPA